MRYREFYNSSTEDSYPFWYKENGAYVYNNALAYYTNMVSYRRMWDVSTPNFRQRSAAGEIINSPMYSVTKLETTKHCHYHGKGHHHLFPSKVVEMDKNGLLPFPASISFVNEGVVDDVMDTWGAFLPSKDLAIAKAWANVDVSEAALLASMGELPETLRWIASLLRRMIRLLKFIKTGGKWALIKSALSKKGAIKAGLSAEDAWMEVRYAIRPLVFEMRQAIEALKAVIDKGTRQTARGYLVDYYSPSDTTGNHSIHQVDFQYRHTEDCFRIMRSGVLYEIENDIDSLLSVWGVGFPLEAIYECTTLSFVLDWFFSVGDTIASWTSNPSLRDLTSWYTEEMVIAYKTEVTSYTIDAGYESNVEDLLEVEPGLSTRRYELKRRVPNPPRSVFPSVKLRLDTWKIIDLAIIGRKLFANLRK